MLSKRPLYWKGSESTAWISSKSRSANSDDFHHFLSTTSLAIRLLQITIVEFSNRMIGMDDLYASRINRTRLTFPLAWHKVNKVWRNSGINSDMFTTVAFHLNINNYPCSFFISHLDRPSDTPPQSFYYFALFAN